MEKWHLLEAHEIKMIFSLLDSGRHKTSVSEMMGITASQIDWLLHKRKTNRLCDNECKNIANRLSWFMGK